MQSSVRRAAHCFNMLRQIRVLQKASKGSSVQAHFDAAWIVGAPCFFPY